MSLLNPPPPPERRCPVCNAVCQHSEDYMDYTLMEADVVCTKCGYYYEFVTGNTTEVIGDRQWWWSWTETHEEALARRQEQAEALKEARELWKGK